MGTIYLDPPATAGRSRTCRQRGTTQLRTTGLYSPGRGGCTSIPRSGLVWSGGFRSYTWSGPQTGLLKRLCCGSQRLRLQHGRRFTTISFRVCFPPARIRFVGPSGDSGPGPTFSPALFYIGDGPERFERAFAGIGAVWVVPKK